MGRLGLLAQRDPTPAAEDAGKSSRKSRQAGARHKPKTQARSRVPTTRSLAIWAGGLALLALLSAGLAVHSAAGPGRARDGRPREVLTFGGTAGLLTALAACSSATAGTRAWSSGLAAATRREAKWVLYAAAIFLAGLLIMFASLQLARTEQRANATLRRVLYGFNSVFVGLLLLARADRHQHRSPSCNVPTTLVDERVRVHRAWRTSRSVPASLDRPVKVYLIMPEKSHRRSIGGRRRATTRLYADCRGLLTPVRGPVAEFKAAYLSPAFDTDRIAALMERLKVKRGRPRAARACWSTVGEDEGVTRSSGARADRSRSDREGVRSSSRARTG